MLGTHHCVKKIWALTPCHFLKNGTHTAVSLTRKVQSQEIKRHIVVYKGARFIALFPVHTYDDSKFLIPISPCIYSHFVEIVHP